MNSGLLSGSTLLLIAMLGMLAGCAQSEQIVARQHGGPVAGTTFPVPLEGARARLEAAMALDGDLRIGFYSIPASELESRVLAELRAEISPESWREPGREVYRDGEWLVVLQEPKVHREIARWAAKARADLVRDKELIQTEVRVFSFRGNEAALLERYGLRPIVPNAGESAVGGVVGGAPADPARAVLYSTAGANLKGLLEDAGVETLSAPRIVTYAGEKGSVTVKNERAYVKDYEVYFVEEVVVADPIIDVVMDGLHIDLEADVTDSDRIDLDASVYVSELHGIEEVELDLGAGLGPVSVELPDVSIRHIAHRSVIADGTALLFRGPRGGAPSHPDARDPWILVRAERLKP